MTAEGTVIRTKPGRQRSVESCQLRERQRISHSSTARRDDQKIERMDYVALGRTGLQVSRICLGCMSYGQAKTPGVLQWHWTLSEEDSRPHIKRALELGVNFFDTANVYSNGESEAVLGRAIRDFTRRDEVVLA